MSCFLFCLFARFELATRGSKCEAFGRNSPGDCFAASALYFCARLRISAGGAAGMSCFLFSLNTVIVVEVDVFGYDEDVKWAKIKAYRI